MLSGKTSSLVNLWKYKRKCPRKVTKVTMPRFLKAEKQHKILKLKNIWIKEKQMNREKIIQDSRYQCHNTLAYCVCGIRVWRFCLFRVYYLFYSWYSCIVAAVKRLPILHYSVVYIFWYFVITNWAHWYDEKWNPNEKWYPVSIFVHYQWLRMKNDTRIQSCNFRIPGYHFSLGYHFSSYQPNSGDF